MITIKLPIQIDYNLAELQRQQSCLIRWAYNRFKDGFSEKDIRLLSKKLSNIDLMDVRFRQSAIGKARMIYKINQDKIVIFGGKQNFVDRLLDKITKKDYKRKRLRSLVCIGDAYQHGNQKFKLDIIQNNKIIFKVNRNFNIPIQLPKLRKNYEKMLYKLEEKCNSKNKEDRLPYNKSLKKDTNFSYVYEFSANIDIK